MVWFFGFLFVVIALDFYKFMNYEKEEERIYKRTVEDTNFGRFKKCRCK